jgi:hypothetical protein
MRTQWPEVEAGGALPSDVGEKADSQVIRALQPVDGFVVLTERGTGKGVGARKYPGVSLTWV